MNPLTNVKNITKLNEIELSTGLIHKKSWHDMYKDSAWIFIGGLEYGLTEGDVLAVFSQYGEIVNINLVRDKKTGKSKGFCFLCYANQKSTVLAVDNFNGIKLCNRTIRVDHVANYKPPKENEKDDEVTKLLKIQGCAPEVSVRSENNETPDARAKKKKSKKEKKEKKKKKKNKSRSSDSEQGTSTFREVEVKKEKHDPGYDKYDTSNQANNDKKRKHVENSFDSSKGEPSSSHNNRKLKVDMSYHERDRDTTNGRYHQKIKSEPESDVDNDLHAAGPSRRHIRSRTPSDDRTVKYRDNRHNQDRKEKERHSSYSKKYKDTKQSSSSSSDDDSRSQSSSSDENRNRYSEKERHKQHIEKSSYHKESRDRSHDNRDKSDNVRSHGNRDKSHHVRSRDNRDQSDHVRSHDNIDKPDHVRSHNRDKSDHVSSKSRYSAESEKHSDYKSSKKLKTGDSDDEFSEHSHYHRSKHRR